MNKHRIFSLVLVLFLLGVFTLAIRVPNVKATVRIKADGSIDPPTANITSVDNVTYTFTDNINESVFVERNNIVVDGAGYIIQGSGVGAGMALTIGRSNVTIKNVEIRGFGLGIKLYQASNNTISGNNITANSLYGIHLESSSQNTISNNNITNNHCGIYLESSSNNILHSNMLEENQYGFEVWGDEMSHYLHSIDTSNLVDGKPVYYLVNQHDITIDPSTHLAVGFLALVNSTNITVEGLTLTRNSAGLLIAYTNSTTIQDNNITDNRDGFYIHVSINNTVSGNNITANDENGIKLYEASNNTITGNNKRDNKCGVYLDYSSSNTISGNNLTSNNRGVWLSWSPNNTVSGNRIVNSTYDGIHLDDSSLNTLNGNNITNNDIGVYLYDSSNITVSGNNIASNAVGIFFEGSSSNSIYHNNLINNTIQVEDPGLNIVWDNGYPSGGNYWSDYTDVDLYSGPHQNETEGDGIWDHPYIIDEYNQDNYPVVPEFPSFIILPPFMLASLLAGVVYRRKRK